MSISRSFPTVRSVFNRMQSSLSVYNQSQKFGSKARRGTNAWTELRTKLLLIGARLFSSSSSLFLSLAFFISHTHIHSYFHSCFLARFLALSLSVSLTLHSLRSTNGYYGCTLSGTSTNHPPITLIKFKLYI